MYRTKKPYGIALVALVALVAISASLTGCTRPQREQGFIYLALKEDPASLDPALIVSVDAGSIAAKVFSGLVKFSPDLQVEPDIAESWSVSQDALVYTFRLREDATFSSGRQINAGDFKYSFERVLAAETKSPNVWIFENIRGARQFMEGAEKHVQGISVLDDRTLKIELEEPFTPFLGLLTMPAAYVVPMEQVLYLGQNFSANPVGSGPFVLKQWLPNRHIKLEASPTYFGTKPRIRGIVYRVIPEEFTRVAEFESGNLDVMVIPKAASTRYTKDPKWEGYVTNVAGLNTYYLGMNCAKPPFDDLELRRAVSQAVDRRKILSTLYEGRGRIAQGPVPDALRPWSVPELATYDPEAARRIINQKKGSLERPLLFYINANDQQVEDIAEVIQSYLMDAGLDVEIRKLEWSAFKDAVNKGEPDLFWLSWWADYADPENFLFPTFHSANIGTLGNRARYSNPAVDALVDAGRHARTIEARDASYQKAEELIINDAPWVFLWHRTDYLVRQKWVESYGLYPIYSVDKGLDISLTK